MADPGPGTLFVVSTPIGNLGDITYRAVETLRQVALIAAEDTRRTRTLLQHFGLNTPLSSFNSYNQEAKGRDLVRRLLKGEDLALVSDAGTPGVSDPLHHLVTAAIAENIPVVSIPGASALLAALVSAGLPSDRFVFVGFLPRKKRRQQTLQWLAEQPCTVVIYESPQRVEKTLADLLEHFGDRPAAVARELTKKFEEINRGMVSELIEAHRGRKWKGEVTLLIGGCDRKTHKRKERE